MAPVWTRIHVAIPTDEVRNDVIEWAEYRECQVKAETSNRLAVGIAEHGERADRILHWMRNKESTTRNQDLRNYTREGDHLEAIVHILQTHAKTFGRLAGEKINQGDASFSFRVHSPGHISSDDEACMRRCSNIAQLELASHNGLK